MATSPLGGFADLTSYRRALDAQKAAQVASDPLADLILSAQQGYALQQLPQTMMAQRQAQQEAALATQLKNALVAEQLNVLRNPQLARDARLQEDILKGLVSGTNAGLVLEPQIDAELVAARAAAEAAGGTPTTSYAGGDFIPLGTLPGGRRAGISPSAAEAARTAKLSADVAKVEAEARARQAALPPGTERSKIMVEGKPHEVLINSATGATIRDLGEAPSTATSLGAPQFVRSVDNPKDIRLVHVDISGQPPAGYEFLKTEDKGMKPSEKITAIKEVRAVYDELPAKIQLFGKGQIVGSNQLKGDLDAILRPVGGDFNKLSPQGLKAFVFRLNKLNDPTSATLLAEASQIANRAGIGERFNAYIENLKSGKDVPVAVAQDIYNLISQVQGSHREQLIEALIPLKDDVDSLNKNLTSIGVPKDIEMEVDRRIAGAVSGGNTSFATVQEAENAKLQKGTRITVGGKPAVVE